MSNDAELLREYAQARGEGAFGDFVRHHLNMVYAAALREADGNAAAAEDITQAVFTEAARKAAMLWRHPALAGWLYTSVRHVAANARRAEHRRQQRERTACAMSEMNTPDETPPTWRDVQPVLDDAMHDLSEQDRTAVVLRFFEGRSLREVGAVLGLTENTARMRVDRALDKLRERLAQRGITSTTAALAATLAAGSTISVPAGLASSVTTAALAGAASAATTSGFTTVGLLKLAAMTKLKITLASALIVAGVALPLWQESRLRRLAAESEALRAEAAALPALRAQVQRLKAAEASRAELERMRAANADLRLEVARLRGLARPAVGLAAAAGTAPDTNRLPAALGGMVKGVLEQQVTGKLARMKSKLNLTAEQEGAIRAALTHQVEKSAEAAQKMLLGKLSKEEMQGLRADHVNPEDQIKAVLTPEQLALYEEFQQEEHVANARLVANAELLQMQGSLGLTPEQQDQVFNALYDYTVRQLKGELTNDLPKNAGVAAAVAWQVDQKVKALAGVLTPEQLASYRQIQEQQTTMLKAFMPEEAGGK